MKKMFAAKEGFTLVELIVVIAILGILAAVAVPAYSGYITKAHEAADITQLDAIKTAAIAAKAEDGEVTEVVVTVDANKAVTDVKVAVGDATAASVKEDSDFVLFYSDSLPTMQSDTYSKAGNITWHSAAEEKPDDAAASWEPSYVAGWTPVA